MAGFSRPAAIALMTPAALLAGAYVAQYGFGLFPCEMCWWQRYALFAALALALAAWFLPGRRWTLLACGLALGLSAGIGAWHAGIEYGWWQGLTRCSANETGGDPLAAVLNAPLVRCDAVQWSLFGISLAGWNFLFSGLAAVLVLVLPDRQARSAT